MIKWGYTPGTKNVAPLSCWGDFVISHWPNQFCVRLRPPGRHIVIGDYPTLAKAKAAAESVDLWATDTGKVAFL